VSDDSDDDAGSEDNMDDSSNTGGSFGDDGSFSADDHASDSYGAEGYGGYTDGGLGTASNKSASEAALGFESASFAAHNAPNKGHEFSDAPALTQDQTAHHYSQYQEPSTLDNVSNVMGLLGMVVANPILAIGSALTGAASNREKGHSNSYIAGDILSKGVGGLPGVMGQIANKSAHGLDPSRDIAGLGVNVATGGVTPGNSLEALGLGKVKGLLTDELHTAMSTAPTNELNTLTQNNAMDQEVSAATDGAFTTGGLAPRPIETAMAFEDRTQHRNPINRSRQRGFS